MKKITFSFEVFTMRKKIEHGKHFFMIYRQLYRITPDIAKSGKFPCNFYIMPIKRIKCENEAKEYIKNLYKENPPEIEYEE